MRVAAVSFVLLLGLSACSDGTDSGGSGSVGSGPVEAGRALVEAQGCVACHGSDGQGGIGPAWVGLAGSDVELEDGSVVVADPEYLRRSVLDPGAQVVAGTDVSMPDNDLTDTEVDQVVAYIESLANEDGDR